MRLLRISALLVFLATANAPRLFAQNYQLVWSDEFDAPAINPFKWGMDLGAGGWGNSELENYTSRTENAYIDSGMLVIKAIKENYNGSFYTSARMKTQGKASWLYGKVEARMKLPYGQGIWPAFWMLGDNISSVSWPKCGEIDIMEMIGGSGTRDQTTYGTAHWDNNGHVSLGSNKALAGGKFADDFHIFSITWTPQSIIWYLDGYPYYVVPISSADRAAFQKKFFIILNLAVGGVWPGNPDLSTVFPQKLYVDYVRVYQDVQTGVPNEAAAPVSFSLGQNYPNPFNPSTMIHYAIPAAQEVRLDVFDVLGNCIATLVDKRVEAGSYSVEWNAGAYPSGVYFYRLRTDGSSATKRLVVQK